MELLVTSYKPYKCTGLLKTELLHSRQWAYQQGLLLLTHLLLGPHICVSISGQCWFGKWLVACLAPSHYLNQCWNIVNSNLGNRLEWNLMWNSYIFIQENTFENVVCEMVVIYSQPQCVNKDKGMDKNHTHEFVWDGITHPCPKFNSGLTRYIFFTRKSIWQCCLQNGGGGGGGGILLQYARLGLRPPLLAVNLIN